MMRALFLRVAIGTCAAISLGASAANAQLVKPKYPGEIAAASEHIAQRNEDCRRQAREQHLHLVKLYRFMRDCKRRDRRNVLPRVADVGSGCTDARPDAQRNNRSWAQMVSLFMHADDQPASVRLNPPAGFVSM